VSGSGIGDLRTAFRIHIKTGSVGYSRFARALRRGRGALAMPQAEDRAMAQHRDGVKGICAAFGQSDAPAIVARLDPDMEWEHDRGTPSPAVYAPRRGREAAAGFFAALAGFDFERFEPVAFLSGADSAGRESVAAPIHIALRRRASGAAPRDLEVHLWTFGPDGRVTRLRHELDLRPFAALA
jgi:hypothetical protein